MTEKYEHEDFERRLLGRIGEALAGTCLGVYKVARSPRGIIGGSAGLQALPFLSLPHPEPLRSPSTTRNERSTRLFKCS